MIQKPDLPQLLERFMEASDSTRRWITVSEFRDHFRIDAVLSPGVSGFLKRIYSGPFPSCPYRVERIEKTILMDPYPRSIHRYLVVKRSDSRIRKPAFAFGVVRDGQPGMVPARGEENSPAGRYP